MCRRLGEDQSWRTRIAISPSSGPSDRGRSHRLLALHGTRRQGTGRSGCYRGDASSPWIGTNERRRRDREGEKDETRPCSSTASMLVTAPGPDVDIAVNPVDGTTLTAKSLQTPSVSCASLSKAQCSTPARLSICKSRFFLAR